MDVASLCRQGAQIPLTMATGCLGMAARRRAVACVSIASDVLRKRGNYLSRSVLPIRKTGYPVLRRSDTRESGEKPLR